VSGRQPVDPLACLLNKSEPGSTAGITGFLPVAKDAVENPGGGFGIPRSGADRGPNCAPLQGKHQDSVKEGLASNPDRLLFRDANLAVAGIDYSA